MRRKLDSDFIEDEVLVVLKQISPFKLPGLDGLGLDFTKTTGM